MTLRQLSCVVVLVLVACGPSGTGTGGSGGGTAGGTGGGTAGGAGGGTGGGAAGGAGGGSAGGTGGGTAGGAGGGAGGGTAGGTGGGTAGGTGGAGGAGGGAGGGTAGGAGGAGGGADGGPSDVTGVRNELLYTNDGGVTTSTLNLSGLVVAAYSPGATGYTATQGVGTASGTFTIPSVPAGPYVLRVGTVLVYTTSRVVDLSTETIGRATQDRADAGTRLSLSMTNLAPWTVNDDLQVASWNAPVDYFSTYYAYGGFAANAPTANATVLSNAELDWGANAHALVKQSLGDDLTVFQLSGRKDAGFLIQEASRGFTPTLVTMQGGVPTPVIGSFTTLAQSSATVDFKFGDFSALTSAVHTLAVNRGGGVGIDVMHGPTARNYAAGYPDIVSMSLPDGLGNFTTPVTYGNPFPASWPRTVYGSASFSVAYAIDLPDGGTTNPSSQYVSISSTQETPGTGTVGPITLVQTPVRFLKVDGVAANAGPIMAASPTPTVSWTLPAIGVPTSVSIRIARLTAGLNGGTQRQFLFSLSVPGNLTSIQLPPGLLVSKAHYFFQVSAEASPLPYNPAKPFDQGAYPRALASALSGVVKTP